MLVRPPADLAFPLVPGFLSICGGNLTHDMTSVSIVPRYESLWQARSPTTRPEEVGGSRVIVKTLISCGLMERSVTLQKYKVVK